MRTYRLRHPSGPSLDIHAEHVSRAMEVFLSAYPHLDEDGTTASIILKSGLEVDWDTGEVNTPTFPIHSHVLHDHAEVRSLHQRDRLDLQVRRQDGLHLG